MFNLSNLNPRVQTESTFSFNDSYNESRKYSLSSSEFDSLSQLYENDLNNIKYVQIGQKNVRKNLNNVSDFATFRVNKTTSNGNIILNGVSKIQRVAKNYWTGFKGGEYDIEMQLIYTPILASSSINRQYRLDKSNSKLIIKELRPNIAERGSSPRLRDAVKLPYLSFITTNNVNGNHNNSSSGSSFTTSPSPTTPSRTTNFVPENYRTTDFNTSKTISDHLLDSVSYKESLREGDPRYENASKNYLKERFITKFKWNPSSRSSTIRSANTSTIINDLFANRRLTFEEIKKFKFFSFVYTGSENRRSLSYDDIGNLKLDRIHKEDKVIIKTFDPNATRFSETRATNILEIPENNNGSGYFGGNYNVDIKLVFDKQLDGTYLINTSESWFSIDTFYTQLIETFGIILTRYDSNSNTPTRTTRPSNPTTTTPRNESIRFNTSDWRTRNESMRRYVNNTSGINQYESFVSKWLNSYNIVNPASSYSLEDLKSFSQLKFKTNVNQNDFDYERSMVLNHIQNTNTYTINIGRQDIKKVFYNKDDFIVDFSLEFSKRSDNRWELRHKTLTIHNDEDRFRNTNKPQYSKFKIIEVELLQSSADRINSTPSDNLGDDWLDKFGSI